MGMDVDAVTETPLPADRKAGALANWRARRPSQQRQVHSPIEDATKRIDGNAAAAPSLLIAAPSRGQQHDEVEDDLKELFVVMTRDLKDEIRQHEKYYRDGESHGRMCPVIPSRKE